jgi:hypothetical protein
LETTVHGDYRKSEILAAEMKTSFSCWEIILKKCLDAAEEVAFSHEKHNICKIHLSRFTVEESKNSHGVQKTYK